MTPHTWRGPATLLAIGLCLPLAACGSAEQPAEADAARGFEEALAKDPARACELMAPRTREQLEKDSEGSCAQGLKDLRLQSATDVAVLNVSGHSAQAKAGEDTLFLALFDDGWRITAAGCERTEDDPEIPYECELEGP